MRLAWLTQQPQTNDERKLLAKAYGLPADTSIYCATQPIYTGAPEFVGMADPMPVRRGVRRGASDLVDLSTLPIPDSTRSKEEASRRLHELSQEIAAVPAGAPRHPVMNSCAFRAGLSLVPPLETQQIVEALTQAASRMADPKDPATAREELARGVRDGFERSRAWRKKGSRPNGGGATKRACLKAGENGPNKCLHNVKILIERFDGRLALDERAMRIKVLDELNLDSDLKLEDEFPRDVREEDLTRITVQIERVADFSPSDKMVQQAIGLIAAKRSFDPVTDYLNGLTWDGVARVDSALATYWGVEPTPYVAAVSRVFFLSCAARGLYPGCKNDLVLVLIGRQGSRKSSSLQALFGKWLSEALSSVGTKDSFMELLGFWAMEVAELDAFSKREETAIKAFLSKTEDSYRPPYGHVTRTVPRRQVFIGTTNEAAPFRDSTGSRRFLPVEVGNIVLEAIRHDRDQIFAEAVSRVRGGEQWYLTEHEEILAKPEQEERYLGDPWEDSVQDALERTERAGSLCDYIRTQDLLTAIVERHHRYTRADEQRLAKIMPRLGYIAKRIPSSIHKSRWRGWFKDIGKPALTVVRADAFAGIGECSLGEKS